MTHDRPLLLHRVNLGAVDVAECIDPDGGTSYWLLGEQHDDAARVTTPEHERLGPLPKYVALAVAEVLDDGRCGATTATGRSCRNPAGRCQWHEDWSDIR